MNCRRRVGLGAILGILAVVATAAPPVQFWRLDNGARVLFIESRDLPIVDARLIFDAGAARDGESSGIARLTNAVLAEGAGGLNAAQLGIRFEQVGAQFGAESLRDMAQLPYLLMGWKVPTHGSAALDWEPYALDLLAGVLDGGRSTRLPREVIRGQALAAAAGADYDGFQRFEGLFIVHGTPSEGVDIAALEAALRDQVDALRAAPVAAAQLQRIKTQAEASLLFSRDSMDVQANLLGALEASGLGWRMLDRYLDRLHAVTAADTKTDPTSASLAPTPPKRRADWPGHPWNRG